MDEYFSFRISTRGLRLLTDPGSRPEWAAPADAVLVIPFQDYGYYESLLHVVQPRVVIPYHFDDHFRSLSKPFRACYKPPLRLGSGRVRWTFPPLQRMSVTELRQMIEKIAPETEVLVPELFRAYDLGSLV
jgi:hypothetical protein